MVQSEPVVLVVGDFMIDRYWIGSATRISPEAPVPVVKIERTIDYPGGAGNVSRNFQALGGLAYNVEKSGRPVKNRLMVGDVQVARWDQGDTCAAIDPGDVRSWVVDGIIVADYNKGAISEEVVEALTEYEGPIFIDTKRSPAFYETLQNPIFFPNLHEWADHKPAYDECRSVIVTMGERGMAHIKRGKVIDQVPAYSSHPRCVNGAGDTVTAAYAYDFLKGNKEPLRFAAYAAAVVVEKPYTAVVTMDEVAEYVRK